MPFIGIGESNIRVSSVNGKIGDIKLTHSDVDAIKNVEGSIGGIQAETLSNRPETAENNTIFIATDVTPNMLYRYDSDSMEWVKIGGAGTGDVESTDVVPEGENNLYFTVERVVNVLEDSFDEMLSETEYIVSLVEKEHDHENKEIIDEFSEDEEGELLYKGEVVGGGEVDSVNGKTGEVILTHEDVGALKNVDQSTGGIQVGRLVDRPVVAPDNMVYIATHTIPNRLYRYDEGLSSWLDISGVVQITEDDEPVQVFAIEVVFENIDTGLVSTDVQNAIIELSNKVNDLSDQFDEIDTEQIESDISKIFSGIDNLDGRVDNLEDLQALKPRVTSLENKTDNLDGRLDDVEERERGYVKINEDDSLGFLSTKIDGTTIKIVNDRLKAERLAGMEVSVNDINALQGISSNIQSQIDNLTNIANFFGTVDTHAELLTLEDMLVNDFAVVISDETQEDITSIYIYNGEEWLFSGDFHVDIRDFSTNPIKLDEEVTGVLKEENISEEIARKNQLIKNTDELPEGEENLYYTEERVEKVFDDKISSTLASTDDLPEGSKNLYYKEEKVEQAVKDQIEEQFSSTDDLPEGDNNKYYSDSKVDSRINSNNDISLNTQSRHLHTNKSTLNQLGEDEEGRLSYKGQTVSVGGDGSVWGTFTNND